MKRIVILGIALLLALAPLSAARAADVDAEMLEAIMVDLETLIGPLEGIDFGRVTARSYAGGMVSYSIPLPEGLRQRLSAASASTTSAKNFKALAAGLQRTSPSNASVLIHASLASPNSSYNFWCAVANISNSDERKSTTIQLKGPGEKFRANSNIDYDAGTIVVNVVGDASSGDFGFHTILCKVGGAGKAKTLYIAAN